VGGKRFRVKQPSSLIISALQIRQKQQQQFKFHLELFYRELLTNQVFGS
jgi:hypothetical protein